MSNYSSLLRDPRWQRKRLEVLQKHSFKCDECYDEKSELNVHHGWYEKNEKPWDYPDECYHVLCVTCHEDRHKEEKEFKTLISTLKLIDIEMLNTLLKSDGFSEKIFHLATRQSKIVSLDNNEEWIKKYGDAK